MIDRKIISFGIDEAGRGCVLGPLCMSLVGIDDASTLNFFSKRGVTDSKKLTADRRDELSKIISKHSYSDIIEITPSEIDNENLNDLEFSGIGRLINTAIKAYQQSMLDDLFFDIYVDSLLADTEKCKKKILIHLKHHKSIINIIAENKADDKYVVVGAASILAKVKRDLEVGKMNEIYLEEFGEIGSGYPGDSRTTDFLKSYFSKYNSFPKETRRKWGTIDKIRREINESNTVTDTK